MYIPVSLKGRKTLDLSHIGNNIYQTFQPLSLIFLLGSFLGIASRVLSSPKFRLGLTNKKYGQFSVLITIFKL